MQVKRLETEKQWLEEQVNPGVAGEASGPLGDSVTGHRPPLRHLSI